MAEQAQAIRTALPTQDGPIAPTPLARRFHGARADRAKTLLETLASLGQARRMEDGRYAAKV